MPNPTSKLATANRPVNLRKGRDMEAWCKITLARCAESIAYAGPLAPANLTYGSKIDAANDPYKTPQP